MKKHLIVLFSILFLTACEKEEAKPCSDFLGMSFDYNGKSFRSEGANQCPGFDARYNSTTKFLSFTGEDCNSESDEVLRMVITIFSFSESTSYNEKNVKVICRFSNDLVLDTLLKGTCIISNFEEPVLTDAGYTKGYISGSFNFVLIDSAFTDTFNITNGRFCISY